MATTLWLNDTDVASLAGDATVVIERIEGLAGGVGREWATAQTPGGAGLTILDDRPSLSERTVRVRLTLHADTMAALLDGYRLLYYALTADPVDVRWSVESDRYARGRLVGDPVTWFPPQLLNPVMGVECAIACHSPYLVATTATNVSLSTSPAACALGTALSLPLLTITGASTVTITYKTSAGATVETATITGATGDIVWDVGNGVLEDDDGDAWDKLTAGDLSGLSPRDGVVASAAWPTLTLSAGTGTAVYRKRWL